MGKWLWLIIIGASIGTYVFQKKSCQKMYDKSYEILEQQFFEIIKKCFNTTILTYVELVNILQEKVEEIRQIKTKKLRDEYGKIFYWLAQENEQAIANLEGIIQQISSLNNRVENSEDCYMMSKIEYGKVDSDFYNKVKKLKRVAVDNIVSTWRNAYENDEYKTILRIQPEDLSLCIWFYAMEKPFYVENFKEICRIYELVHKKHYTNECFVAELFSVKQMGGDSVLRSKIQDYIRKDTYGTCSAVISGHKSVTADVALKTVASALMWIQEYDNEKIILEEMLARKLQMPAKLQERLHSLSNGGGKAPKLVDVETESDELYFDISTTSWKEEEYHGLFENLKYQEKILTYALAIRDEDKEVFADYTGDFLQLYNVLEKMKRVFANEYGDTVKAKIVSSIALCGEGREVLDGILVETKEYPHLGMLVHLARIGKTLNIKFYTLFRPVSTDIESQKQQVISMYKKMSPNINMWEKSLKGMMLLAIQQILNDSPGSVGKDGLEIEF